MWSWVHRQSVVAKTVLGGIAAAFALITAGLTIDDRYARANDVHGLRQSQERYALQHEIAIHKLRQAQVYDNIQNLRAREAAQRGRLFPHERQALDRFNTEYGVISKEIENKQRLADRLRFQQ